MLVKKSIEEIVEITIIELKQKFVDTKLKAESIHIVLKEIIELVEHFGCPGSEKKKHVIKISITKLIIRRNLYHSNLSKKIRCL